MKRNIDPTEFKCVSFMDALYPRQVFLPPGIKWPSDETLAEERRAYHERSEELFGTHFPPRKCAHCGKTGLRWLVAVEHVSGRKEAWGEICGEESELENFPALEAHRAHKAAESGRSKKAIAEKFAKFEEAYPGFTSDLLGHLESFDNNSFLNDLREKLSRYGDLSERQVEAARKSMVRDREYEQRWKSEIERRAQRMKSAGPLPVGRVEISGKVISARPQESDYGTTYKWLVELDDGNRVWGSVPKDAFECMVLDPLRPKGDETTMTRGYRSIYELPGMKVRFTATVEQSNDDEHFGFYKRPTKLEILEEPASGKGKTS